MSDGDTSTVPVSDNIEEFRDLYPRQQTRFEWSVLNVASDNGTTAWQVNTRDLSCTCPAHNFDDTEGTVCKHLAAALYHASRTLSTPDDAMWAMSTMLADGREAVHTLRDAAGWVETVGASEAAHAATEQAQEEPNADAEDAAERLKAAYDDAIDDMQVEVNAGKVWIQTGRDTPDEWPYPGESKTFNALLKNPEQVQFVSEGGGEYPDHEWLDDRPSKWYRNAMLPEDVDSYIDEVLG